MFELIVARYNENIDWIKNIDNTKYKIIVYNKIDGENIIPNRGREAYAYFYHIIKNYDSLADMIAFVQAGWNDKRKISRGVNIINDLNNIVEKIDYRHLADRHKISNDKYGNPNGKLDLWWYWNELFETKCPDKIYFSPFSMFCCSKEIILIRSKAFYEKCLSLCDVESDLKHHQTNTTRPNINKSILHQSPWAFERLFNYIFSKDIKAKI